jgi:hypothetical protein
MTNDEHTDGMSVPAEALEAFGALYRTIKRLRAPGGCPWDIEQTPLSLRETLIEESYETSRPSPRRRGSRSRGIGGRVSQRYHALVYV